MKSSSFDENYLLDNKDSASEDEVLERYAILLVESGRTICYWGARDARSCASYCFEARSSTPHDTIVEMSRPPNLKIDSLHE